MFDPGFNLDSVSYITHDTTSSKIIFILNLFNAKLEEYLFIIITFLMFLAGASPVGDPDTSLPTFR
jgi:hypothetical protein